MGYFDTSPATPSIKPGLDNPLPSGPLIASWASPPGPLPDPTSTQISVNISGASFTVTVGGMPGGFYGFTSLSIDGGPFGSIDNPVTPYGSVVSVLAQEGSDYFALMIRGASVPPAQNAFPNIRWTDSDTPIPNTHTYNTASAIYSTL